MSPIRVAIVGVGNCASSLVQGVHYYRDKTPENAVGLMHWRIGDYGPTDMEVVVAFDIDARKVGRDVNEAVFALPNCTTVFCSTLPNSGVKVRMGRILDGFSEHLEDYPDHQTFVRANVPEADHDEVVAALRAARAEVMLNYLPVGSEEATRFYAECALEAGVALVNCMPVFIASDAGWAQRFRDRGLPLIGDDIKAQLGATITHRMLTDLFHKRGVKLERTYQLNTGGNTDFLNMLNRSRLRSKKTSKTEAVQSVAEERLDDDNIHIGPSDLELRLSVEDSPNSAGVAIDMVRCAKLALERGQSGVLDGPAAYFCKHPPRQYTDDQAHQMTEAFIAGAPFSVSVERDVRPSTEAERKRRLV
ncbi:MAG: inositol-3-phosphate synthase [Proteobacteria bacterium]|nr:inositol-3-phosphate synthase [Pseudomonadota bacterium]